MAAMGITEEDIALVLGISAPTLRKHCAREIEVGHIEANAKVAQSLFKQATDTKKPNVAAAIFWMKARAGWSDGRSGSNADEPPGKKKEAERAARGAETGTKWDGLLPEHGKTTPTAH